MESANLNAETMLAMKKGSEALKGIHTSLYVYVLSIFTHHFPPLDAPVVLS